MIKNDKVKLEKNERVVILDLLSKNLPSSVEVLAYGSRVHGSAHLTSDLDLVIRNTNHLDTPLQDFHLLDLRSTFRESLLPFRVDVLDWALLSETFKQEILKEYEVIKSAHVQKTALITAASKGIGYATACLLAKNGYHVIGISRTKPEAFPGDFYTCDLMDAEATKKICTEITNKHKVTILVNNMGYVIREPIEDLSVENLHTIYDGNVRVAVQCVQAVLPTMKAHHFGRIINISSLAGIRGVKDRSAYGAAKAALAQLARTWTQELGACGITVNAIAPGTIETKLFREGTPVGSAKEAMFLSQIPSNRLGQPHEVAAAIAFFASDDAGYISGQVLNIDGGSG